MLQRLSAELGDPGLQALWTAARRRGLNVTHKDVETFVKSRAGSSLGALQPSKGKTVSEDDNRWQMDLIKLGAEGTAACRYILVCVNVFDRFLYARALRSKETRRVRQALEDILASAKRSPQIISMDGGSEFKGDVAQLLSTRGIVARIKAPDDVNALGVVDRAIGLLKRRLAERAEDTGRTWGQVLHEVVAAMNRTPRGVLHGDHPGEISDEVRFMLLQEQARAIQHNMKLHKRPAIGAHFRAPLPGATKKNFRRGFQTTYGPPQRVVGVRAGTIEAEDGSKHALKQIRILPVN